MEARERYARVLRAPHARALLIAEIPARLPVGINGLAIVLFLREHSGSYAAAGAVAAAFGLALGVSSPLIGRLIDRRGLAQVVLPLAMLHTVAMVGLVALGLSGAPVGVLALLAVFAGAFLPPLGSISRSLWPRILRDEDPGLLSTALALEGVMIELVFVAGPLITALLSVLVDPAAALLLSPVLLLGGLSLFLMQPPVRTWVISEHAGSHGPWGALRSPGIRTLVLCTLPMGFCFGAMEVTLPAFGEAHGHREIGGVLLAVWSAGSAMGGLLYGARHWSGAAGRRYARLAALLPIGYLPLALAPSIAAMVPLALLAGLSIAPTLTAGNQIAGDVAPEGTETEAYTWPVTSLVCGLAIGSWVAGALVEGIDWQAAFLACAGGAVLSALLAALRWRTLQVGGRRGVEPAYDAAL
ncbi:MAG TPA: MFS transporter [Baekduia sp.]|uniref:MFS transporter n=1 Tax=Baekduia sp. TaxID=2600305 RepID=UPI002D0F7F52|nr:MFS transporter [Baekduia sp.]HMJ35493.1 MFS transporter [Baekduia sp.]